MKRMLLLLCVYFIVFVFLGILWYYPVMPFIFYSTLADPEMKLQMEDDLIEFYGIVQNTHQQADRGATLTTPERVILVLTPAGEFGFLLWPVIGVLLGLWRGLPFRYRIRKQMSVSPTYNL